MWVVLSAIFILFQFGPSSATLQSVRPGFHHSHCDDTHGNYTSNSTFHQNLIVLFDDIISSNSKIISGFYNFSYGEEPNTVYGIGYCRGDVLVEDCRSCLQNATTRVPSECFTQKRAVGYYDKCVLRYSDHSMHGVIEILPIYQYIYDIQPVNQSDFNRVLYNLLGSLVTKTAEGNSTLKFSMNKVNVSTFVTIYAFTQCSPDLSHSDCRNCLSHTISDLPVCCRTYRAVRFFRPSCNLRFQVYKFADAFDTIALANSSSLPHSLPPAPRKGKGITRTSMIVAVVTSLIVLCLSLVVILYLRQAREDWKKGETELEEEDEISSNETLQIPYGVVKNATQEFSEANELGKGGFGIVYKGVLPHGQEIAVKRLARNSVQGEEEFRTEVLLVAKLQHRNLVRLLGYSLEGEERHLIYEFLPNGSLDHFLFGKVKLVTLDWPTRYNIVVGIARGLLYLHEDSRIRIVHRDLKTSNILLDTNLNPKIADFGMARLFQVDQTHADTERIAGTFGYMAPEYAYRGVFSVKSDIYSFGVLLLEIVTGQKNSRILKSESMDDLLTSVWRNWKEGTACEVVDTAMESAIRAEIMRCIQLGLLCVQADPANRPTMSSINLMLSSEYSQSMPMPRQPAYVLQRTMEVDPQSLSVMEEESITELQPR